MSMPDTQKTPRRVSVDCRRFPSESQCSLKLSGTVDEVLEAAVQHAVSAHGHESSPQLREQIRASMQDEAD